MDRDFRIKKLLEIKALKPDDPFPVYTLGLEYLQNNDIAEAEKYFAETLLSFPDYLPTYYQYGKLLEEKGELKSAENTYKSGIALAEKLGDNKTKGELEEAVFLLWVILLARKQRYANACARWGRQRIKTIGLPTFYINWKLT